MISDFREGIQEFSKNKGIVNLVVTTMIILFFVGMLQALFIPMMINLTTIKVVGTSQSIQATGILIGSLFIGLFGSKNNNVKILAISLFLGGIFFANIGISTNIFFITMAGFLFFATLPFINTPIEVLIRKNIDNRKQGRVWSIISNVTYLGSIMAFAVAGILADKIFNPLFEPGGLFVENLGRIIGIGNGRGIALIFIISGIMIVAISFFIRQDKKINELEDI